MYCQLRTKYYYQLSYLSISSVYEKWIIQKHITKKWYQDWSFRDPYYYFIPRTMSIIDFWPWMMSCQIIFHFFKRNLWFRVSKDIEISVKVVPSFIFSSRALLHFSIITSNECCALWPFQKPVRILETLSFAMLSWHVHGGSKEKEKQLSKATVMQQLVSSTRESQYLL